MKNSSANTIVQDVRCSYVYVTKTNKDGKYSIQALIPTESAQFKKLAATLKKVFVDAFGEKEWAKKGRYNLALRNGDNDAANGGDPKEGDEYRGHHFMNCSNNSRPGIVNRYNKTATEEELEEFCYSGATFHVSITLRAYEAKEGGKPGVGAYVRNIMLRGHGERLDGSVSAESEFEEFAEEASDIDEFDEDL